MTRRPYILIYNDDLGTREEIKTFLDQHEEIINWRYDLPNTFYLVSEKSAKELYEIMKSGLNTKRRGVRFLICEWTANRQGWLPKDTWSFLNLKS